MMINASLLKSNIDPSFLGEMGNIFRVAQDPSKLRQNEEQPHQLKKGTGWFFEVRAGEK